MPAVQEVTVGSNVVQTTIGGVQSLLNISLVPSLSPASAEAYLNNIYLPTLHGPEIQMVAHVFTAVPLLIKLLTLDAGVAIPNNWWLV